MNAAARIRLVAGREYRERSRSKGFRISLVISLLLIVVAVILPSVIGGNDRPKQIGVTSSAPAGLSDVIRADALATDQKVTVTGYPSADAGERALRDGSIDVLVVGDQRLEWKTKTDDRLKALVTGAIQVVTVRDRAQQAGLSSEQASGLLAPVDLDNHVLAPKHDNDSKALGTATVMVIVLFIAVSTYGGLVLAGVVEEKSSRVIEVLLVRVPPRDLLTGKILGIGLLGLTQFALVAAVGYATMLAVHSAHAPTLSAGTLAWAVVWFVVGYAFYSVVYGSLGAMASRMEDAQGAATPVTVLLLVAYFFSFAAISDPRGVAALVGSYLPPVAPLVMPIRLALDAAPWWQALLALAVTGTTIYVMLRFAARLYSGAVLRLGAKVALRDAWKAAAQR